MNRASAAESVLQRWGRIQESQIKSDWCRLRTSSLPSCTRGMAIMTCSGHKYPSSKAELWIQVFNEGKTRICMCRRWTCLAKKPQKNKKPKNLWRAQISFVLYLSSGPASCYALVCFWPRSSGLGMAAFPLAGICGINTKVILTVSIGSDCSWQLLWYSNLRDSRTHLWVDVVAAICTNCII